MLKIAIVFTCFNRKEKTINCIKKLATTNSENELLFYVVDDKSTDGTATAITELGFDNIKLISGTGSLFWNGGMHLGVSKVFEDGGFDFVLLVNDDVDFYPKAIDKLVCEAVKLNAEQPTALVGATCDDKGNFSYGGIKYTKGIKYVAVTPSEVGKECSTFNANCTLIPYKLFETVGNIDPYYKHSMGDFDLGFRVVRAGGRILVHNEYIGVCNDNPIEGSWQDRTLSVRERIKKKESFKGLPFKDWFHYLNKNFGLPCALMRSITPYIKILLHK